jgi:CHAD domain-containing protein/CYTH domain-containing protein
VRLVALGYLAQATRARPRLADPADAEGLHDFRVALRRLRSCLRAFRSEVESTVGRRLQRGLRRLADATGESRDLQVHRVWVEAELPGLTPRELHGAEWLLEWMGEREDRASQRLARSVAKRFPRIRRRLARRLSFYPVPVSLDGVARLEAAGAAVARSLADMKRELERALNRVHSITDDKEAHLARIAAKRLRYLLEPFADELPEAGPVVERLKLLQDALGDLHDVHVFAGELRDASEEAAAEDALLPSADPPAGIGLRPRSGGAEQEHVNATEGLIALASRLRQRGERTFAGFRAAWYGGSQVEFFAAVEALVAAARSVGQPPREIERKYLLHQLPPHALTCPAEEIEQGWLPGTTLVERLRRVRSERGEEYYRTVKTGSGMSRVELEEAATCELFDRLWSLTEGCRVIKRRYRVPEGELTWEMDEFTDRQLVLAEVEIPREDYPVTLPAWLEPYVVREVTGERDFVNRNLAQ